MYMNLHMEQLQKVYKTGRTGVKFYNQNSVILFR